MNSSQEELQYDEFDLECFPVVYGGKSVEEWYSLFCQTVLDKAQRCMMPVDWSKYPNDWKEIATSIKAATDWTCQVCGKQCYRPGERVANTQDVLTVAHVNHVESDCRPENLVAACAVCHLRYDSERSTSPGRRW